MTRTSAKALRLAAGLALGLAAAARGQGIEASLDRTEATLEEQLTLTVRVDGSRSARPELPALEAFKVRPAGQSTQVQILNGQFSSSVTYTYLLLPRRTGTFILGPATVELDGTVHSSPPITVRIVDAVRPPGAGGDPSDAKEAFLSASVSNHTPYVGEQVTFTWRFHRRVPVANPRLESLEFPGFTVEELGEVREFDSVIGEATYRVSELRRALFPQEAGTLTIPATTLTADLLVRSGRRTPFDDFFGRSNTEPRVLRTPPLRVTVRPLPPPPSGFTGLVGQFEVTAQVTPRELHAGESTTLEVTVAGIGNVQRIDEPRGAELPGFKVYGDRPQIRVDRDGERLRGWRTFTKALVPLEVGERQIPPFALTYFDPEAGAYRTASTPPLPLSVLPPAEEAGQLEVARRAASKLPVRVLADDLLPIHTGLAVVGWGASPAFRRSAAAAGILLPPLAYAALLAARRRSRLQAADAGLIRRRRALRDALAGLHATRCSGPADAGPGLEGASRCLRGYVGDKLGLEGRALTAQEAGDALRRHGVSEELTAATRSLLERLEAARYGSAAGAAGGEDVLAEVEPLVRRLERELRS